MAINDGTDEGTKVPLRGLQPLALPCTKEPRFPLTKEPRFPRAPSLHIKNIKTHNL